MVILDGKNCNATPLAECKLHKSPVTTLSYHPRGDFLISTARRGMVELWHPATGRWDPDRATLSVSTFQITYKFKMQTDLFHMVKEKAWALSATISPDGNLWAVMGSDLKVRVFHIATGMLKRVYSETLESADTLQVGTISLSLISTLTSTRL